MSRREKLELTSAPFGEDCAQVGEEDYRPRALRECSVLRRQLVRMAAAAGVVVSDTLIRTRGSAHDFGTYYELVCVFDEDDAQAAEAAHWLEANLPEKWDAEARAELSPEDA